MSSKTPPNDEKPVVSRRKVSGSTSNQSAIPFHKPYLGRGEENAVLRVLRSGWWTMGPETLKFEHDFATYVGSEHAAAVSSGTAGMHLALLAAGIGPGCEVITSVNTFCATLEAIEYTGAHPVLADVEEDTLNLSPTEIERKITPQTRAILGVDFAGHPCNMDAIRVIAKRHGLFLLVDAAHSMAAQYRGRPVGGVADATVFSFYVTKPLATGEGGMVTTNTAEWDERIRVLRLHGMNRDAWKRHGSARSWYYEVEHLGYKCNMTDLQAALGRVQLRRQETLRRRRDEIAAAYREGFADIPEVTLPAARPNVRHAWHLFVIRVRDGSGGSLRDAVIAGLAEDGIGASVHFIPMHYHPYYAKRCRHERGDFPVAERAFEAMLSLPIFPAMKRRDVQRVIESVQSAIAR